ncbi:hypothetical protein KKA13_00140 [Patescibacteria group bacterium]|nr:hypothetical protein [Patescibacteria group bacterium]
MARKFEVRWQDWLPRIVLCYLEYEELDTFFIVKSIGRRLQSIGSAEEQLAEINSVLNLLVEKRLLTIISSNPGYYWGINFNNIKYSSSKEFEDLVKNMQKTTPNSNNVNYQINKNIYNFNLTLAFEKLLELKTGLINL